METFWKVYRSGRTAVSNGTLIAFAATLVSSIVLGWILNAFGMRMFNVGIFVLVAIGICLASLIQHNKYAKCQQNTLNRRMTQERATLATEKTALETRRTALLGRLKEIDDQILGTPTARSANPKELIELRKQIEKNLAEVEKELKSVAEKIKQSQNPVDASTDLKGFWTDISVIIIWLATVFGFMSFVSSVDHQSWFFGLIPLLTIGGLGGIAWDIKGDWVRPSIFYTAVAVIVIIIITLTLATYKGSYSGPSEYVPSENTSPSAPTPAPAPVQKTYIPTPAPAQEPTPVKPAVTTLQFFPNKWDLQDKALQKVGRVVGGKYYFFKGFGKFTQYFAGDKGELKGKHFEFGPMGANWVPNYKEALPMPDKPLCSLIGMVNGEFFFIGEGALKSFPSDGDLYITINHVQDKAQFGNPARNFIDNEGFLTVLIREE